MTTNGNHVFTLIASLKRGDGTLLSSGEFAACLDEIVSELIKIEDRVPVMRAKAITGGIELAYSRPGDGIEDVVNRSATTLRAAAHAAGCVTTGNWTLPLLRVDRYEAPISSESPDLVSL